MFCPFITGREYHINQILQIEIVTLRYLLHCLSRHNYDTKHDLDISWCRLLLSLKKKINKLTTELMNSLLWRVFVKTRYSNYLLHFDNIEVAEITACTPSKGNTFRRKTVAPAHSRSQSLRSVHRWAQNQNGGVWYKKTQTGKSNSRNRKKVKKLSEIF